MACEGIRYVGTLPAVYDDSLTYYEMYCKLANKLNEVIATCGDDLEALKNELEGLYDYVHGPGWEAEIEKWVDCNLPCIVAQTCKWFHFGISDKGNVVCTIPFPWSDFTFNWNMDYGTEDFGKLTIGW